jgi:hypothetical protein
MLPAELWEPSCKSRTLPVDPPKKKQQKTINKRGSQGIITENIILLFNSKYKRRWTSVIYLKVKHKIYAVS